MGYRALGIRRLSESRAVVGSLPSIPNGKGLFLRSLNELPTNGRLLKTANIRWVIAFGDSSGNGAAWRINREHIAYLNNNNCDVWICTYNRRDLSGGKWESAKRNYDRAMSAGALGPILDMEGDWKGYPEAAYRLVDDAKRTYPIVGFTGLGVPGFHTTFPWEILQLVDFSMPQLYDVDSDWPRSLYERGVREYKQFGTDNVIPVFGMFKIVRTAEGDSYAMKLARELKGDLAKLPVARAYAGFPLPSFWNHPGRYADLWRALTGWNPQQLSESHQAVARLSESRFTRSEETGAIGAGFFILTMGLGALAALSRGK